MCEHFRVRISLLDVAQERRTMKRTMKRGCLYLTRPLHGSLQEIAMKKTSLTTNATMIPTETHSCQLYIYPPLYHKSMNS
jgi:hypothetical protein